jgi:hypothetical protein
MFEFNNNLYIKTNTSENIDIYGGMSSVKLFSITGCGAVEVATGIVKGFSADEKVMPVHYELTYRYKINKE